jgi:hypothetical protein
MLRERLRGDGLSEIYYGFQQRSIPSASCLLSIQQCFMDYIRFILRSPTILFIH